MFETKKTKRINQQKNKNFTTYINQTLEQINKEQDSPTQDSFKTTLDTHANNLYMDTKTYKKTKRYFKKLWKLDQQILNLEDILSFATMNYIIKQEQHETLKLETYMQTLTLEDNDNNDEEALTNPELETLTENLKKSFTRIETIEKQRHELNQEKLNIIKQITTKYNHDNNTQLLMKLHTTLIQNTTNLAYYPMIDENDIQSIIETLNNTQPQHAINNMINEGCPQNGEL